MPFIIRTHTNEKDIMVQLKRGRPSKETSKAKEKLHAVADGPMILSESDRESIVSCKRKCKSVDETTAAFQEKIQKPVKRSSLRSNKKSDTFYDMQVMKFI
jgi:hypothetical protein